MALTLAWMSACDIDGVKITTFGPKPGLVVPAPVFGSAEARAPAGSTAATAMINPAMPAILQRPATRRRRDEPVALAGALSRLLICIDGCLSGCAGTPWTRWRPDSKCA